MINRGILYYIYVYYINKNLLNRLPGIGDCWHLNINLPRVRTSTIDRLLSTIIMINDYSKDALKSMQCSLLLYRQYKTRGEMSNSIEVQSANPERSRFTRCRKTASLPGGGYNNIIYRVYNYTCNHFIYNNYD